MRSIPWGRCRGGRAVTGCTASILPDPHVVRHAVQGTAHRPNVTLRNGR